MPLLVCKGIVQIKHYEALIMRVIAVFSYEDDDEGKVPKTSQESETHITIINSFLVFMSLSLFCLYRYLGLLK